LASAMVLFFFMAFIVGFRPEKPTIAVSTMSALFSAAICDTASSPAKTFML